MIDENLIDILRQHFRLDWHGIHGIGHWRRVGRIGAELALQSGADQKVVAAFALLHDSCRRTENGDHRHGQRAARLATELNDAYLMLGIDQIALLRFACARHEAGKITGNATVGTCWDADRLDLWRIGVAPDHAYLSTAAARDPDFILRALDSGADEDEYADL